MTRPFWAALLAEGDLAAGAEQLLTLGALTGAWTVLPP